METNDDHEYRGLIAEAWDVLRGDTSEWADRAFYRDAVRAFGEPVLDVGCGTGRLLLDYRADGMDIDGVDNSPEMLALCQEKAQQRGLFVTLHLQHVERLDLPRRYRTILVPSSTLQLVTDLDQAREALRRLHAHLESGGAVLASVMTLWQEGQPAEQGWEVSATRDDGVLFRRVAVARYDRILGCEHTEDRYEKIVDGQVVARETHRRSPATRSYTQAQARALFEEAGFSRVDLLAGFTDAPATPTDTLFTVRALRDTAT